MTAIWYLMGLLLLAYMGSFLFGGHAIRGFGLPSSAEYVVLGFLLGPMLGLIEREQLASFDMLTGVAIGWVALVIGLDYGFVDGKRVRLRSALLSASFSLITGGALFGVLYLVFARVLPFSQSERLLLAGGVAVACSETTRHAVRWVMQRHGAQGPLSRLLAEMADSDDLLVILATAALFALHPPAQTHFQVSALGWIGISLGLGVLMGGVTAVLLGRDFRLDESWGVLLGTSMLAIGVTAKLGLSPLSTMFVMGASISFLSRHRTEVTEMTAPTERAVLLPTLLLAGARIDLGATPLLLAIVACAVGTRIAAQLLCGLGLRLLPEARKTKPWAGLALLPTGGLAMCTGLAFALRFPGPIGDSVLAAAAAVTVFGEFVGPTSLSALLRDAGEIGAGVAVEAPLPATEVADESSATPLERSSSSWSEPR